MTELDAARAICDRFIAAWNLADGPFGLPNEAFVPPVAAPWLRLSVLHFVRARTSIGSPGAVRYRSNGSVIAQVFVPRDTGTTRVRELGIKVRDIFESKTFGGVRCYATSLPEIGVDGNLYQLNAETPFDFDEIK